MSCRSVSLYVVILLQIHVFLDASIAVTHELLSQRRSVSIAKLDGFSLERGCPGMSLLIAERQNRLRYVNSDYVHHNVEIPTTLTLYSFLCDSGLSKCSGIKYSLADTMKQR